MSWLCSVWTFPRCGHPLTLHPGRSDTPKLLVHFPTSGSLLQLFPETSISFFSFSTYTSRLWNLPRFFPLKILSLYGLPPLRSSPLPQCALLFPRLSPSVACSCRRLQLSPFVLSTGFFETLSTAVIKWMFWNERGEKNNCSKAHSCSVRSLS